MIDWSASMQQTFEFYEVDPSSWKDKKLMTNIISCSITRDPEAETLGSATFDIAESVGECYIRVYLVAIQDGIKEKFPLGTFLVQTPSSKFDGRIRIISADAYTPLIELKEKKPPIGYNVPKGEDVMSRVYDLLCENMGSLGDLSHQRISKPIIPSNKLAFDFVYDSSDTWLTFISDLLTGAYTSVYYKVEEFGDTYTRTRETIDAIDGDALTNVTTTTGEQVFYGTARKVSSIYYCIVDSTCYLVEKQDSGYVRTSTVIEPISGVVIGGIKTTTGEDMCTGYISETYYCHYCAISNNTQYRMALDGLGRVLFVPQRDLKSSQPIWTYTDDNSSILYPELTMNHDLYGIPNVVEVLYSDGNHYYYSKVENNNENSPVSIPSRRRQIVHRVTDPEIYGTPSQERIDDYAEKLLDKLSSIEYTIIYTHGYCPVNVGDCVRFNYSKSGLTDIKAMVVHQSIKCTPGCPVTEKAVFTSNLWR